MYTYGLVGNQSTERRRLISEVISEVICTALLFMSGERYSLKIYLFSSSSASLKHVG